MLDAGTGGVTDIRKNPARTFADMLKASFPDIRASEPARYDNAGIYYLCERESD